MTDFDIQRRPPFGHHGFVGERGHDTRRRILEGAMRVFDEVGFDAASVDLITQEAGCSRPSFYQYFSSKHDVFRTLAGRLGKEMVQLGTQLQPVTADAAGVARLEEWVEQFLALRLAHAPVFAAFQRASREDDGIDRDSRPLGDRIVGAVRSSFGPLHTDARSTTVAYGIVGVMIQVGELWPSIVSDEPHERLVRGLARFMHRVVVGPVPSVNLSPPVRVRLAAPTPLATAAAAVPHGPRGRRTRQLLLEAGARVLPLRGFNDARVDDIVGVAGLSHGTFYRYFDSKEDLFRVLATKASEQMLDHLDAFSLTADDSAKREWMRSWFADYDAFGGVFSAWQELASADPGLTELSKDVATRTLHRLVSILRTRDFGDPLIDGLALLALLQRMPHGVATRRSLTAPNAIDATVLMVDRGLAGRAGDVSRAAARAPSRR